MQQQFCEFIKSAGELDGGIGLTHVTDCANLDGIIASGKLEARHCTVFGRNLLYLFYGKPAYRRQWDESATTNLGYARVCFVLRDTVSAEAHRMLPFDSGAFFTRYRHAFYDKHELEVFDVEPTVHPRKIVAAFYKDFADYYWMKPLKGLNIPLSKTIVDSYYKLITGGLTEKFDDRCATIELQYAQSLPLTNKVEAIIAPNQLFEDEALMAKLAEWGAEPRGYNLPHMFNPNEIAGRLFDEVSRYLEDMGYM